jgi:hypothetical protein
MNGISESLIKFLTELEVNTGIRDGVVKIALTPELFNRLVLELASQNRYGLGWPRITDLGELVFRNVQIVARNRDSF